MSNVSPPVATENAVASSSAGTPVRKPLLRRVALLEIIVFLGGALLIDQLLFDGTRFRDMQPHPFWIPVVLLSVQYGSRMGLVAAFACTVVFLFGNVPERLLEQDLHQWFFIVFKLPILWSVSAVIIGEISARHIGARNQLSQDLNEAFQRESTLAGSFHTLNVIKERMEIRVAGQWRTVSKTLKAARSIEHLDPSKVLSRSQDLVENLLECEKFSIYLLRENALHCSFDRGWDDAEDEDYLRVFRAENPLFTTVVGERRVLCISNPVDEGILGDQGVLAGPLIVPETGEFLGMLKIERLSFGQLSLNTVKDFEFLCEWIGSIYGKAVAHQLSNDASFSEANQIFQNARAFEFYKNYLSDLARRVGFNLTMITIRLPDYAILPNEMKARFMMVLGQSVKDVLRKTDLFFKSNEGKGEYALLLTGTEKQYMGLVKARLRESLEERLASLVDEVEYTLETESLAQVDSFLNYTSSGEAEQDQYHDNDAFFVSQKRFLVQLAARLEFPLTMLYLQVADFDELSEVHVKRFSFIMNKALDDVLGSASQALFHRRNSGGFFILLPGVDEVETKRMVMVLDKMLMRNRDAIPVRYSHQIQVLKADDSTD